MVVAGPSVVCILLLVASPLKPRWALDDLEDLLQRARVSAGWIRALARGEKGVAAPIAFWQYMGG